MHELWRSSTIFAIKISSNLTAEEVTPLSAKIDRFHFERKVLLTKIREKLNYSKSKARVLPKFGVQIITCIALRRSSEGSEKQNQNEK